MKIQDIIPNPNQPRKDFDPEKIKELADNIKQVGLKQPLIVRPLPNDGNKYQLVDGERRYRACKLIPLEDVPVEIREDIKTDEDAALQSYIINDQRQNYNAQDKEAYIHYLHKDMGLSTRKIAEKLGVHHSHIDHLLEAYRFRQKLLPTQVGTLQLTHSALKNTAMIKDDSLRLRVLQAIQDNKIKTSEISEKARVFKDAPRELYEAYFADLIDWATVIDLAEWVESHGSDILGFYARDIPLELKKDVINQFPLLQNAVVPDMLDWCIEKETEDRQRYIELHIELNPHKDAKYVRNYAEKQIKKWQREYKKSVKDALFNFKKKYQKDAADTKGGTFWIDVFYWIVNSIMTIQQTRRLAKDDDIDLRIAIIDMLYTNEILLALRAGSGGEEEGGKKLDNLDVREAEERSNAKALEQHEEIAKRMGL